MELTNALRSIALRSDLPDFHVGDTVKVHVRVVEGEKERLQIFQGVVIRRKGTRASASFTVRKISSGIGVERIFPVNSPSISSLEVVRRGHVRRAKLYYLRGKKGKAVRLREKRMSVIIPQAGE